MDGMIFAAGLGTRLRPLTDNRPKALVEVGGKPLLEHVIGKMLAAGIHRIVVNVHHYADRIEDFLRCTSFPGAEIVISDERDCLLDTGGGLLKARPLFTPYEPVVIHNVDILTDMDLREFMDFHCRHRNYVTLMTAPAGAGRGLRFDNRGVLTGWENRKTGERKVVNDGFHSSELYSFCGVHVVSPDFLNRIHGNGAFSIIDEYLRQARMHDLRMYFHPGNFMDLGTPEAIAEAEKMFVCGNK